MAGKDARASLPVVTAARGARVRDASGREYIDLCMGYGSVWLGHAHPAVREEIAAQLETYAAPGYLPSKVQETVHEAMASFMPDTHFLGGLYSTGMEAVETALRAAVVHTGRRDIAGFAGSVHGRSYVTAALGGRPAAGEPGFVHRLKPFTEDGQATLERDLSDLAARVPLAAIVVEPVQMTGGGYAITSASCRALFTIARAKAIPVIFDETLTGLHRCGPAFFSKLIGETPDITVLGKGIANGFPCAAVILRKGFAWDRASVRPGSTFWNHPLACAAAGATLRELSRISTEERVGLIATTITEELGALELRGRGALWCLGVPDRDRIARFAEKLLELGIVVSYYDRFIRLLPPATIDPEELRSACRKIREAHADTFR